MRINSTKINSTSTTSLGKRDIGNCKCNKIKNIPQTFRYVFLSFTTIREISKQQNTEIQYNKQRIHLLPREPSIHSKNKRRFQLTGLHVKPNFSNQYNPSKSNATRQNTGHNALTAKYKNKWDYKKEYLFSQMQCQSE